MVYIVILDVVREEDVQRVPWECVAGMVINSLDRGEGEQKHPLSNRHP